MMGEPEFAPNWLSAPGSTIGDLIATRGMSVEELTDTLGFPLEHTRRLLQGSAPITDELAHLLADTIGGSASFWLSREAQFRQEVDRQVILGHGDAQRAWLEQLPVSDMARLGWIKRQSTPERKVAECLRFFETESLSSWREKYDRVLAAVAFRASPSFEPSPGAILAWLQFGKLQAANIACADWNREQFVASLPDIRKLTRLPRPSVFIPKLREILAKSGVAVVIARTPSGCHTSGATSFVSPNKAMMLLSFRHRSDDQFWFTVFHEAGHLALHENSALFIEDGSEVTSTEEQEANEFATEVLLPNDSRAELGHVPLNQKSIQRFAVAHGISRGIVIRAASAQQRISTTANSAG